MMEARNVSQVVSSGLCCSCGLCESVCPIGGVSFEMKSGFLVPHVNKCCGCGRCLEVCPGKSVHWNQADTAYDQLKGPALDTYSAWSKNEAVFRGSTSGGVATQLVRSLLVAGVYDVAFLVGEAAPGRILYAEPFGPRDDLSITQKSKYLQVSHARTLSWMADHPLERAVIVAVPCAVRGILKGISLLGLNRENYLLIGLFCDKTMQYGVLDYLASLGDGGSVNAVDFRNKEISGWPGDVVMRLADGTYCSLPKERRMEVKEYFCPERCLYCLDKLNVCADISLGDDYTETSGNREGANSAIIRTEAGARAWTIAKDDLEFVSGSLDSVALSQKVDKRMTNHAFARMKEAECGTSEINEGFLPIFSKGFLIRWGNVKKYRSALRCIAIGADYAKNPSLLNTALKKKRSLAGRIGTFLAAHIYS